MVKAEAADKDGSPPSEEEAVASARRAGAGRGGHRPQHISTVAHLFFQSRSDPEARPAAGGDRDIAVGSPGFSAVAAFAAAGLAAGTRCGGAGRLNADDVFLQEDRARLFSAASYLEPAELEEQPAADRTRSWRLVDGDPGQGHRGATPGSRVVWRHLGPVGSAALARMSLLITDRSLADLETGGGDGLVWCLLENEAASLRSAMLLGSLVYLLQPARVEILVFRGFADGPPDHRRLSAAGSVRHPERRSLEIARRACGELPLAATLVDLDETVAASAAGSGTGPLAAVRDRLLRNGHPGNEPV